MTTNQWLQTLTYCFVGFLLIKPMGGYMAQVYGEKPFWGERWLGWLEKLIYKICGINPKKEMNWKLYAFSLMIFTMVGGLFSYAIFRLQALLPFNPAGQSAVSPDLSFNSAISFVSNTDWQFYGGESTMSYLSQMVAVGFHMFTSPAVGLAIMIALVRSLVRKESKTIGNFWSDMVRGVVYIMLPISLVVAFVLLGQGVPQTFANTQNVDLVQATSYDQPVTTAAGAPVTGKDGKPEMTHVAVTQQPVALGPVASLESIKMLGTNGGGFFNVNSAHPYECPTLFAMFLEMILMGLIPSASCYTLGVMLGDKRQGWAILVAMFLLFAPILYVAVHLEQTGNPVLAHMTLGKDGSSLNDGNMEGKDVRFGVTTSALWACFATGPANGSVCSMHDSFTPLGGLCPLWFIMLGEVAFGGAGSGLYGKLVFVILAVFVAGLMVGRTPEYLGKKIQAWEMKMASLVILIPPVITLIGTALGVATDWGKAGMSNPGAHGFTEVLYAFASMSNNNGSAFAGITVNPWYNVVGGICMWVGRYWLAIPALAIAGSLVRKKVVPESAGTLPTHTPLFVVMLVSTVIIVGALTFFPAMALGPIVEHLKMIHF